MLETTLVSVYKPLKVHRSDTVLPVFENLVLYMWSDSNSRHS